MLTRHMILGFITEWRKAADRRRRRGEQNMRKSVLCSAAATLAITLTFGAAHADGLPGMRGHDHTGITVPD
jgi:hypothetical protein